VSRSVHEDPEGVARRGAEQRTGPQQDHIETPDLSSFLEQYRPMLRLLSSADLSSLRRQGYSGMRQFRRERVAIYFQYLRELCRDLRALPVWEASNDAEAFIEMDKASWMMQKMLVKLAMEGLLYYVGIQQRDSRLVERCFEKLGRVLNAAA
jgi:hypothetical protein